MYIGQEYEYGVIYRCVYWTSTYYSSPYKVGYYLHTELNAGVQSLRMSTLGSQYGCSVRASTFKALLSCLYKIELPAGGYWNDTIHNYTNQYGWSWCTKFDSSSYAWALITSTWNNPNMTIIPSYQGHTVRARQTFQQEVNGMILLLAMLIHGVNFGLLHITVLLTLGFYVFVILIILK